MIEHQFVKDELNCYGRKERYLRMLAQRQGETWQTRTVTSTRKVGDTEIEEHRKIVTDQENSLHKIDKATYDDSGDIAPILLPGSKSIIVNTDRSEIERAHTIGKATYDSGEQSEDFKTKKKIAKYIGISLNRVTSLIVKAAGHVPQLRFNCNRLRKELCNYDEAKKFYKQQNRKFGVGNDIKKENHLDRIRYQVIDTLQLFFPDIGFQIGGDELVCYAKEKLPQPTDMTDETYQEHTEQLTTLRAQLETMDLTFRDRPKKKKPMGTKKAFEMLQKLHIRLLPNPDQTNGNYKSIFFSTPKKIRSGEHNGDQSYTYKWNEHYLKWFTQCGIDYGLIELEDIRNKEGLRQKIELLPEFNQTKPNNLKRDRSVSDSSQQNKTSTSSAKRSRTSTDTSTVASRCTKCNNDIPTSSSSSSSYNPTMCLNCNNTETTKKRHRDDSKGMGAKRQRR